MKIACVVIFTLSFFFTLGSVGAMDCNHVGMLQGTIQAVIGLAVCFLAGAGLGKWEGSNEE